jgi:predicted nucleotidyltransferase
MDKEQILESIKKEKPFLQSQFGVEEIGLFGSFARGEEKETSDVDILVLLKKKTLSNYFDLLDYLESKLNKKIDLVTNHPGLSDRFRKMVGRDIVYV